MKQSQEQRRDKSDINKMLKYTAKKVLWLINYSLSFSEKNTGRQIGIKILACLVLLHCFSMLFFVIFSLLEIILLTPFFALGLFVLIGVFIFKKEVIQFLRKSKGDLLKKRSKV